MNEENKKINLNILENEWNNIEQNINKNKNKDIFNENNEKFKKLKENGSLKTIDFSDFDDVNNNLENKFNFGYFIHEIDDEFENYAKNKIIYLENLKTKNNNNKNNIFTNNSIKELTEENIGTTINSEINGIIKKTNDFSNKIYLEENFNNNKILKKFENKNNSFHSNQTKTFLIIDDEKKNYETLPNNNNNNYINYNKEKNLSMINNNNINIFTDNESNYNNNNSSLINDNISKKIKYIYKEINKTHKNKKNNVNIYIDNNNNNKNEDYFDEIFEDFNDEHKIIKKRSKSIKEKSFLNNNNNNNNKRNIKNRLENYLYNSKNKNKNNIFLNQIPKSNRIKIYEKNKIKNNKFYDKNLINSDFIHKIEENKKLLNYLFKYK